MGKKILFVIDTLQTGGAEQSLLDNVSFFSKLQPVVCHLYAGETLKQQFIERGVPVHSVNIQKKYGFIRAYNRLRNIVQAEKPDLIVACLTRSELISRVVGKMRGVPVTGTFVSDLYAKAYNVSLSRKSKAAVWLFRLLNRATAGFCKSFIANSESIKRSNAVCLHIPLQKIQVINRGRDSRLFTYQARSAVPGKPVRFLNIARLVTVKGQRNLILAFREILLVQPNAVLHIAGEGPARDMLVSLIQELRLGDHVSLLGNRRDVPQLMQAYDCFVLPSLSEGFSGSVVEAMMSGLPVLASNIPANQEVITHLETGYLFEAGEVAAITGALLWYINNREQAHQLAEKAYDYAKQHFELEQIAASLENYLNRIAAEKI
jgi:glycosyltransferase involved in cell wall biosynthesis